MSATIAPPECKGFAETTATKLVRACGSYGFRSPKTINAVLVAPDETIVTVDEARVVAYWDLTTGARGRTVSLGEGAAIVSAALSRDGSRLFVGQSDGRLAAYDLATSGQLWNVFATSMNAPAATGPAKAVPSIKAVALSPDGRHIATFGETESVIRLWEGQRLVGELPGREPIAFSPDGRFLFSQGALYEVRNGRAIARMLRENGAPLEPNAATFSPDGSCVCAGGTDGSLRLWHPASGRMLWTAQVPDFAKGHASTIYGVFFSADGATVVTTSVHSWQTWNAMDGKALSSGRFAASGVVHAARAARLFGFAGNERTLLKQLDLARGQEPFGTGHTEAVTAIAFSPRDKNIVLTGSADGTAKLWELASGTNHRTLEARHKEKITSVAFLANGARVVAAGNDSLRAWDADTGTQVAELSALSKKTTGLRALRCMVARPEGTRVVLCVQDGHLRAWDTETQADVWDIELDTNAVGFTTDGKVLITVSKLVGMVDANTGGRLGRGVNNPNLDGQRSQPHVFFRNADRAARVITDSGLTFGSLVEKAEIVPNSVAANHVLAMSPDARLVVSSISAEGKSSWNSKNGSAIAIWDVEKKERIDTIDLASSDDQPVCAAIDGTSLLVGTARGMLLHFELRLALSPSVTPVKSNKGGTLMMAPPSSPALAPTPAAPPGRATTNNRVTVPDITGEGWLVEETITASAMPVTMFKCKRVLPNEFFFMLAKAYEVAPHQALTADDLTNRVFRGNYEREFERVQVAGTRWIEENGVRWYEAALEMQHAKRGLIAKVERTCAVGPKVYILSAEGSPADVRTHFAIAERWFAESSFADLTASASVAKVASAPPMGRSQPVMTLQSAPPVRGPSAPPVNPALEAELQALIVKGNDLYQRAKLSEAKALMDDALTRTRRELGESHRLAFVALANAGEIERAMGDAASAQAKLEAALKLGTAAVDASDPELTQTIMNLGRARLDQEDVPGAEQYFIDGLERARRRGPTTPQVAQALSSLGFVQILRGEFAKAEKLLRDSLAMVAPPAIEGLRTLHNLGRAVGQGGRLAESEPLLEQALEGRKGMLGPDHPDTIESTASLGTLFFVSNRPERAEPLFRLAADLTRRVHGSDSLLLAERLVDVALNANALGDPLPGLHALTEALRIRRRKLGKDHERTKWTGENLIALQRALGVREGLPED